MKKLSLENKRHQFGKITLGNSSDEKGLYDLWQCENCGMIGKRRIKSNFLELIGDPSEEQILKCNSTGVTYDKYIGKYITVIECGGNGKEYENITPQSIHKIIKPINGYFNDVNGVWIKGTSSTVRLLTDEFTLNKIRMRRTKFKKP